MQMIATKITWVQWPFEWCIQCRVWVHHNNLLRPNLPVCSSVYIWMTVNEIHFYLNNVGTETFRTRYRTTNFNVWWFSKTDLPPPPPTNHRKYNFGASHGVKNNFLNLLLWTEYRGQSWFIKLHTIAIVQLARKVCFTQLWNTNENLF